MIKFRFDAHLKVIILLKILKHPKALIVECALTNSQMGEIALLNNVAITTLPSS